MNPVTQILLLVSYAIVGLACAVFLPYAGIASVSAQVIGGILFVSLWQGQITFFRPASTDETRLNELEKLALKLRRDVGELKQAHADSEEKGTEKDRKLISELQLLQTYLVKMMTKEANTPATKGKGSKKASSPTGADGQTDDMLSSDMDADKADASTEDEDRLTEEEIAELGLAPEEAAMVVEDEDILDASLDDEAEITDGQQGTQEHPAKGQKTKTKASKIVETLPGQNRKRAPIRLIKREDQLLSVVKNSLSENRIDLYLQPIVGLPSRNTAHFECFSRVRDEEGRIVLPRQYMKVAETKGLIGTIDNLLLFRLIQLVRRLGKRRSGLKFFCNMSRYSLADPQFFPQFVDFMVSNREFAERLVFEISQDDYMVLDDDTLERLDMMGRRGFAFSMDMVIDYNQNFTDLSKQHFRFIKSNFKDIKENLPDSRDIADQIAHLRRHSMQWIMSRVESEEMVIDALENRFEFAQGYLFGEPRSANDMNEDL